jgi:hypothetical protein
MVLKVGDQVVPVHHADLCSDSELTYCTGDFKRGEVGVVIETVMKRRWFEGDTIYARVLSSGCSTGWCSSRFLIDIRHRPRHKDPQ